MDNLCSSCRRIPSRASLAPGNLRIPKGEEYIEDSRGLGKEANRNTPRTPFFEADVIRVRPRLLRCQTRLVCSGTSHATNEGPAGPRLAAPFHQTPKPKRSSPGRPTVEMV